jgi:hypothetical protein
VREGTAAMRPATAPTIHPSHPPQWRSRTAKLVALPPRGILSLLFKRRRSVSYGNYHDTVGALDGDAARLEQVYQEARRRGESAA